MWYDDFTWSKEWQRLLKSSVRAVEVTWSAVVLAGYWSAVTTIVGGTKDSLGVSADGQKTEETDDSS